MCPGPGFNDPAVIYTPGGYSCLQPAHPGASLLSLREAPAVSVRAGFSVPCGSSNEKSVSHGTSAAT